jgi:hypothetical protein
MTPRLNSCRDTYLAAIPAAGASIAKISDTLGITRKSAEQRLRNYAASQHLYSAKIGHNASGKSETWYFLDSATRDAAFAAYRRQVGMKRCPTWDAKPAHNPGNVKPVQIPNTIRRARFEVETITPTAQSFSSMRPGQYDAPPSKWLSAIEAARAPASFADRGEA